MWAKFTGQKKSPLFNDLFFFWNSSSYVSSNMKNASGKSLKALPSQFFPEWCSVKLPEMHNKAVECLLTEKNPYQTLDDSWALDSLRTQHQWEASTTSRIPRMQSIPSSQPREEATKGAAEHSVVVVRGDWELMDFCNGNWRHLRRHDHCEHNVRT